MKVIKRPDPINEEVILRSDKTIMSKTNSKGIIEYANDYFVEISGYKESELIGQAHNVIRHPDMPKVIFKWLWQHLEAKKNIHALVKNLTKEGKYYWVITTFEVKSDAKGNVISFFARRKAPPIKAVKIIDDLYRKILAIEKTSGIEVSEKYLNGFLEEKNMTYNEYITEVCLPKEKTENIGTLLSRFFFNEIELRFKS